MSRLLEIEDLHVQYNTDDSTVYALNGLNFALDKGETIGLVGETGAGKTTLALSILSLLPAQVGEISQGSIVYDGQDILSLSKNELRKIRGKRIAMIFQDPMTSLNPTKTVGKQIREVLDTHFPSLSKKQKQDQVDNILLTVGIPPDRQGEYPFQFSGGMKQRIGIAMALVGEPELLLADEPTTALDVTIQAQILDLMRNLQAKFNTSMILITHDLGVVVEICSKVAVIYSGQIIESGTIQDVYSKIDNHPYTEGLFKCSPNLKEETNRLTPIAGQMPNPVNLPSGCKFHDRCIYRMEVCEQEEPGYFGNGTHHIKCHRFAENWGDAK